MFLSLGSESSSNTIIKVPTLDSQYNEHTLDSMHAIHQASKYRTLQSLKSRFSPPSNFMNKLARQESKKPATLAKEQFENLPSKDFFESSKLDYTPKKANEVEQIPGSTGSPNQKCCLVRGALFYPLENAGDDDSLDEPSDNNIKVELVSVENSDEANTQKKRALIQNKHKTSFDRRHDLISVDHQLTGSAKGSGQQTYQNLAEVLSRALSSACHMRAYTVPTSQSQERDHIDTIIDHEQMLLENEEYVRFLEEKNTNTIKLEPKAYFDTKICLDSQKISTNSRVVSMSYRTIHHE